MNSHKCDSPEGGIHKGGSQSPEGEIEGGANIESLGGGGGAILSPEGVGKDFESWEERYKGGGSQY